MDIFSLVGKITINYADAVNNIEKVSKSAKDTAETLEDVDKKADGAGDSVEDAGQAAKNADSGFTTWKATLANLASTAITKVISGCTQLAEKMADVTKSAVGHYAEYEQLVGGVETLFKDSSGKLIDYAEKAYKTAGMSSNQYMNTATSFAASLIQGLGGDTAKAVELTNLAITDMSDNANKMGICMVRRCVLLWTLIKLFITGDGVQSINSKQIVHLPLSQLIVMLNRTRLKQIQQVNRGCGMYSVLSMVLSM